jgi:hypothetical protein
VRAAASELMRRRPINKTHIYLTHARICAKGSTRAHSFRFCFVANHQEIEMCLCLISAQNARGARAPERIISSLALSLALPVDDFHVTFRNGAAKLGRFVELESWFAAPFTFSRCIIVCKL